MAAFIIAVCSLKGGTGKTTIAVNLACELGDALLIDSDSQRSASAWCAVGKLPTRYETTPLEGSKDVARWSRRLVEASARYIVIDCPPHIGVTTEAAVGVADVALVPTTPSGMDLVATEAALQLIRHAREFRKAGPKCLLIPSRVDIRTAAGREIVAVLKRFHEPIGPIIHQRAVFVDSFSSGEWVGSYAPSSDAHADITALARAVRRLAH